MVLVRKNLFKIRTIYLPFLVIMICFILSIVIFKRKYVTITLQAEKVKRLPYKESFLTFLWLSADDNMIEQIKSSQLTLKLSSTSFAKQKKTLNMISKSLSTLVNKGCNIFQIKFPDFEKKLISIYTELHYLYLDLVEKKIKKKEQKTSDTFPNRWYARGKFTFYSVFFPSYPFRFTVCPRAKFALPTKTRTIMVSTETEWAWNARRSATDSTVLLIRRRFGHFYRLGGRWLITDNALVAVFKCGHHGAVWRILSIIQIAWASTYATNTACIRVVI